MTSKRFLHLGVLLIAAGHWSFASAGQSTRATLFGTLYDEQRAVLSGAAITLTSSDTGQTQRTTSDRTGNFQIIGLTPGRYELRATLSGFAEILQRDLVLTISQDAEVILTMKVAPIATTVTVATNSSDSPAPLIAVGRTITTQQIDGLPVNSRDFMNLALLTPGILVDQSTGRNPNLTIAASGQIGRNNTFLVDGFTLDDHFGGLTRGSVSLDAVKEFKVLSSNFSAEYGQASGAIVAVLTRSGTNQRTGRAFYYRRDDHWDATSAAGRLVDPPEKKTDLRGNDVGGFLGGPIVRNRAFYFGSAERTSRDTESLVTSPVLKVFRPDASTRLPVRFRDVQLFARGDFTRGERDTVTVRYRRDNVLQTNQTSDGGPAGLIAPERRNDTRRHDQDAAVTANHIFGTTALNEFRFQFARRATSSAVTPYCPDAKCPADNRGGLLLGKSPVVPARRTENRYQLVNTVSWIVPDRLGDHTFKTGIDVSAIRGESYGSSGFEGIWRFRGNDPAEYPTQYTLFVGDPLSQVSSRLVTMFVQDDWKPVSNLTMNLGARWDYEHAIGVSADRNNVAPRLGIAFDPWKTGKTAIRGGYGIYYDAVLYRALNNGTTGVQQVTYTNPGYPCAGQVMPCRATTPDLYGPNPNGALSVSAPGMNRPAASYRTPYSEQTSAGMRHMAGRFMMTADVVWARGHNLIRTRDANYPNLDSPSRPRPRPDPTVGRIRVRETEGHSWYRGLLVGVHKRHARGHSYGLAYTLSRSERDTEDWEFIPNDQRDYAAERGPGSSDVRHRLVANVSVDLPFGIRVTTIVTARSALPYNITAGEDLNLDGETAPDRPQGVSRNSARGDDFQQIELRLSKQFDVWRRSAELFIEAFNATNHTNWTEFDGNVRNQTTFGKPTSASSPREVQVGFRVGF